MANVRQIIEGAVTEGDRNATQVFVFLSNTFEDCKYDQSFAQLFFAALIALGYTGRKLVKVYVENREQSVGHFVERIVSEFLERVMPGLSKTADKHAMKNAIIVQAREVL